MPTLWKTDPVVAIACSDVHLSLKPPIARAQEDDWMEAQARPWREINKLRMEHANAPVLCAGDLFDRWNSAPELINWAIQELPLLHAIPGNHDLPSHRMESKHRSAYETLVRANKINEAGETCWSFLQAGKAIRVFGTVYGGCVPDAAPEGLNILLTHEYCWIPGAEYHNAPEAAELGTSVPSWEDYDVVVVGDNHQGFQRRLDNGPMVFNCGTLMRRKSNEADYKPHVGLIHASGKVVPHYLDTSQDVLSVLEPISQAEWDSDVLGFVKNLMDLTTVTLSFRDTLLQMMAQREVSDKVRDLAMKALDG